MLSISLPSLKSFKLFSREKQAVDIPAVKVHEIESAQEKSARSLKHLLKLNHANYAILYNDRRFHNHAPHVRRFRSLVRSLFSAELTILQLLSAAFLQGADADDLARLYESESKLLDPWVDSPAEITAEDWRDHLGCREYVVAFAASRAIPSAIRALFLTLDLEPDIKKPL